MKQDPAVQGRAVLAPVAPAHVALGLVGLDPVALVAAAWASQLALGTLLARVGQGASESASKVLVSMFTHQLCRVHGEAVE